MSSKRVLIWPVVFLSLMPNTCWAADNITPVGFKSLQKCREYQQYNQGIQPARINVASPSPVQSTLDPDRIIFSRSTDFKQNAIKYPYAAAVFDQNGIHQCGGTLISDKFILLEALCMTTKNLILKHVLLGIDKITPKTRNFLNISRTIPHPQYQPDKQQLYSDIGLIELEEPVRFSKKVRPACLSSRRYDDADDWFLVTWDVDSEGTPMHRKIAVTTDNCHPIYDDFNNVTYGIIDHLQICVKEHDDSRPHQPNSIVVSNKGLPGYTVVGTPSIYITSSTFGKVYTRVAGYIKWIESIVWPDLPTRGCNKFNFLLDI